MARVTSVKGLVPVVGPRETMTAGSCRWLRLCFEHVLHLLSIDDPDRASNEIKGGAMEVIVDRCAGLDVHKKTVVACVRTPSSGRWKRQSEVRTFGTFEH